MLESYAQTLDSTYDQSAKMVYEFKSMEVI